MSKEILANVLESNPPRLVITYERSKAGQETLDWSASDGMPTLSLIGELVKSMSKLSLEGRLQYDVQGVPTSKLAVLLAWDEESRSFRSFYNFDTPIDVLLGYLEMVKVAVSAQHVERLVQEQSVKLLVPGGGLHYG